MRVAVEFLIRCLFFIVLPVSVHASLITFEDTDLGGSAYVNAGDYDDFHFSDNLAIIDTVGGSWDYGAVSGENTLLNFTGGAAVVTAVSGGDFSFNGFNSRLWMRGTNADIAQGFRLGTVYGYSNGVQTWSQAVSITETWGFFAGVDSLIDELRFDLGNNFLLDDLDLSLYFPELGSGAGATVPSPGSLPLLLLGLFGLVLSRRKSS